MPDASADGWDERPHRWAEQVEPAHVPFYEAVLDRVGVTGGTRLLDAGCGAGLALALAAGRGAVVAGLDASPGMLAVARERVPGADLRVGDLEALPFDDGRFDVVTAFNALQFSRRPERTLREMGRVVRPGGQVAVLVWGEPARSDMRDVFAALAAVGPRGGPGAPGPFALSAPGAVEALMGRAGLVPEDAFEVPTPFAYPDLATAVESQTASGVAVRAMRHAGRAALTAALEAALVPYRRGDGTVRLDNMFRAVVARA